MYLGPLLNTVPKYAYTLGTISKKMINNSYRKYLIQKDKTVAYT